jgi:hypothetical protein
MGLAGGVAIKSEAAASGAIEQRRPPSPPTVGAHAGYVRGLTGLGNTTAIRNAFNLHRTIPTSPDAIAMKRRPDYYRQAAGKEQTAESMSDEFVSVPPGL